jgi:hypothetical protein
MLQDFQNRFGLPITGKLDDETVKIMNAPRYGMKDKQGWYFHFLLLSKRKGKESKKLSFPKKRKVN